MNRDVLCRFEYAKVSGSLEKFSEILGKLSRTSRAFFSTQVSNVL